MAVPTLVVCAWPLVLSRSFSSGIGEGWRASAGGAGGGFQGGLIVRVCEIVPDGLDKCKCGIMRGWEG